MAPCCLPLPPFPWPSLPSDFSPPCWQLCTLLLPHVPQPSSLPPKSHDEGLSGWHTCPFARFCWETLGASLLVLSFYPHSFLQRPLKALLILTNTQVKECTRCLPLILGRLWKMGSTILDPRAETGLPAGGGGSPSQPLSCTPQSPLAASGA